MTSSKKASASHLWHKIFLTCGPSSLITSCAVLPGNRPMSASSNRCSKPIETSTVAIPVRLRRDRGFYSQANLSWAKGEGIVDAAFDRKGTLAIDDMVSSSWIYKQLRRFRAGIEGCISWAKRVFGLDRCTWKAGSTSGSRCRPPWSATTCWSWPACFSETASFFLTQPTRY